MTEPKKFKKGKHSYTRWGNFKEVRVEHERGAPAETNATPAPLSFDVDNVTETGVYSNVSVVHTSPDEVLIDFCFVPPGQLAGRVRSRVVLPFKHVRDLNRLLTATLADVEGH